MGANIFPTNISNGAVAHSLPHLAAALIILQVFSEHEATIYPREPSRCFSRCFNLRDRAA